MTLIIILILSVICLLLLIAYLYFVYSPSPAEPKLSANISRLNTNDGTYKRSYLSYVPTQVKSSPALVIAMHGTGMDASKMRLWTAYELDEMADEHGFIVAYPDGYKGNWNDCRVDSPFAAKLENINDTGFIRNLIGKFRDDYNVDPSKIFVFGFSNGGQMAMKLAMEIPHLISGITAISANLPPPETCSCVLEGNTSDVMLITGTKDSINPYDGGEVSLFGLKKVGRAISALATAENFVKRNGITAKHSIEELPAQNENDSTSIVVSTWKQIGKPRVELFTIVGGGHVIPQSKFRFPRLMGKTAKSFSAANQAAVFFGLVDNDSQK